MSLPTDISARLQIYEDLPIDKAIVDKAFGLYGGTSILECLTLRRAAEATSGTAGGLIQPGWTLKNFGIPNEAFDLLNTKIKREQRYEYAEYDNATKVQLRGRFRWALVRYFNHVYIVHGAQAGGHYILLDGGDGVLAAIRHWGFGQDRVSPTYRETLTTLEETWITEVYNE